MSKLGVNRDNQKKINRGLVLKLIATRQCSSRVELAKATGLSKMAISQIVTELISKNYLVETEKENTCEPGRNPVGLAISPLSPRYAGVLIQRGYCEAVLCDMALTVIKSEKIYREWKNEEELMDSVYQALDHILEGTDCVLGIGAASIGPVSIREGKILHPRFFNNIKNVELRSLIHQRYHLPVFFDHDNQSAALVEHLYGNAKGYEDALLVSVGKGVGCGIMMNGRRVHNHLGYAPEIGHVSIDYHGELCDCGNVGCLECYVNTATVMERFRKATGENLTYAQYCQLSANPLIDEILLDMEGKLANALINVLNILNSQIVLLCMDCTYWPDKYIQMLEDDINNRIFENGGVRIPVKKTKFLYQSQVLGAACNAIHQVFLGELLC